MCHETHSGAHTTPTGPKGIAVSRGTGSQSTAQTHPLWHKEHGCRWWFSTLIPEDGSENGNDRLIEPHHIDHVHLLAAKSNLTFLQLRH